MTVAEMVGTLGLDVKEDQWTKGALLVSGLEAALNLLRSAASAAAGLIEQFIGETMAAGDAADKTSKALGISAEEFQALAHAADLSGVSVDQLRPAFASLARNAAAVGEGNEQMADAFRRMGVSATDANGKLRGPVELLASMADGLGRVESESERVVLVQRLMGESGGRLLPMLEGGAEGMRAMMREAHAFGIVMDTDAVASSVALTDSMTRLRAGVAGLRNMIAGPLLPVIQRAVDAMTAWWLVNQELVKVRVSDAIARLVPVLETTARVLVAIGKASMFLLDHWREIAILAGGILLAAIVTNATAIGWMAAAYTIAGVAAVQSAVTAAAAWLVAAGPFIALGVIIGVLAEDIYQFATGGESLIGDFVYLVTDNFKTLSIVVGEVWETIETGASVAMDAISGAIDRAATWLEDRFIAVRDAIVEAFEGALDAVLGPLQSAAGLLDKVTGGGASGLLDAIGGGFNAMFGGGAASPSAAAGMGTSTTNSSRQVNINSPVEVRVAAAPGMSTEAVGGAVADSLSDQMDRMWSDAAASVGV